MEMREGLIASGLGHAAVFGWAVVAGVFDTSAAPPDLQVTEVSVISTSDFAALVPGGAAPQTAELPAMQAPDTEAPTPRAPESVEAPTPAVRPNPTPAPDSEAAPPTPPEPVARTEVEPDAPEAPAAPAADPDLPVIADRPTPREAPRVAPTPAPAPPPEAEIAPVVQDVPEPTPSEAEPEPQETPRPTAPEEATTEIVTEADRPSGAPERSQRPTRRPSRPVQQAAEPEETPAEENPLAAAIAGALEEAQTTQAPRAAPSGPPLTASETDGLRLSVQSCWNVGSLSSAALRTKVTIAFDMNRDGTPLTNSLRMIASEGGDDAAARQAYEAGRRAIIRCGASGFDLPIEKYDHWREIEMTFNPEQMRIR